MYSFVMDAKQGGESSFLSTEIAVVVPCFNNRQAVEQLVLRTRNALDQLTKRYVLVIIDDGSTYDTWDVIQNVAFDSNVVAGIKLTRNFGQQAAISGGLDSVLADWYVLMDGDLQDEPEDIPDLLSLAKSGFDVVLARVGAKGDSERSRGFFSILFHQLFSLVTDSEVPKDTGSFRVMPYRAIDSFRNLHDRTEFFIGMVTWSGFPTATYDVVRKKRIDRSTGYGLRKRVKLVAITMVSFSKVPLYFSVFFGFSICVVATIAPSILIYLRLSVNIPEIGFASIMVALFFLSGTVLITLGVLGLYIGSIARVTSMRPLYVVDKIE
jgi:dolichol-phosphate mannosyltransferase